MDVLSVYVRILLFFLRRVSTHSTPQSTHRRASERAGVCDQCVAATGRHGNVARHAQRANDPRRSCVSACSERARGHARTHEHARMASLTRSGTDGLLRRAATRLAKDRVQRTIDGPANFAGILRARDAHDDKSAWLHVKCFKTFYRYLCNVIAIWINRIILKNA